MFAVIREIRSDQSVKNYAEVPTQEEAEELVASLKARGYSNTFFKPHPGGNVEHWKVVDGEIQSDLQGFKDDIAQRKLERISNKRASEYPPIGDQLDALWKGGDDAEAMKAIINKVKSDNPKG